MNIANNPSTYHGLVAFERGLEVLGASGVAPTPAGATTHDRGAPSGDHRTERHEGRVRLPLLGRLPRRGGDRGSGRASRTSGSRRCTSRAPGSSRSPVRRRSPGRLRTPRTARCSRRTSRSPREHADVVVLSWHWGLSPSSGVAASLVGYQTEMAHFADIDHGVDLVFGHHSHVLSPIPGGLQGQGHSAYSARELRPRRDRGRRAASVEHVAPGRHCQRRCDPRGRLLRRCPVGTPARGRLNYRSPAEETLKIVESHGGDLHRRSSARPSMSSPDAVRVNIPEA